MFRSLVIVARAEQPIDPNGFASDPSRLFNSGLDGNTRRAIDIYEGEKVDAAAFKALVRAAAAHNGAPAKKKR